MPAKGCHFRNHSKLRFRSIFGPAGSETRTHGDPFVLAKSADPAKTQYLDITAGNQEALLAPIVRFVAVLKQRNYAFEFYIRNGGHDWNEWDTQVPGCFDSLLAHIHRAK